MTFKIFFKQIISLNFFDPTFTTYLKKENNGSENVLIKRDIPPIKKKQN